MSIKAAGGASARAGAALARRRATRSRQHPCTAKIGSGALPVEQLPSHGLTVRASRRQRAQPRSPRGGAARAAASGHRPPGRQDALAGPALPGSQMTRHFRGAQLRALAAGDPRRCAAHDHRHGRSHRSRQDHAGAGAHRRRHRSAQGREGARHLDRARLCLHAARRTATCSGFIDVPGHERLVHTMVAGACGIDFALLVVAADDGVMPQTREHLAILELLGVSHGCRSASPRSTGSTPQRLQRRQAELQAAARLHGTAREPRSLRSMPPPPITPAREALRQHLHDGGGSHSRARTDAGGLFRLAVDRVFTLAGHGTVVTGTVFSRAACSVGDTLVVMPAGRSRCGYAASTRKTARPTAGARASAARSISSASKRARSRAATGSPTRAHSLPTHAHRCAAAVAARKRSAPVTSWSPVHLHLGTAHRVAHVVPLEAARTRGRRIRAGAAGF